jgi:hypothetical protein
MNFSRATARSEAKNAPPRGEQVALRDRVAVVADHADREAADQHRGDHRDVDDHRPAHRAQARPQPRQDRRARSR